MTARSSPLQRASRHSGRHGASNSRPAALPAAAGRPAGFVHATTAGDVVGRDLDGAERWRQSFGSQNGPTTEIVVADLDHDDRPEVIATIGDGTVRVIDGVDGRPLWQFIADGDIEAPPVVIDVDLDGIDELIVGSHDRYLYCLRHYRR